jgi:hypothetical protein
MPYIKPEDRARFGEALALLQKTEIRSAGELNYLLTKVVHYFLEQRSQSYQAYNDALGALEGAKLELYRRRVAPYEDIKIQENGDV